MYYGCALRLRSLKVLGSQVHSRCCSISAILSSGKIWSKLYWGIYWGKVRVDEKKTRFDDMRPGRDDWVSDPSCPSCPHSACSLKHFRHILMDTLYSRERMLLKHRWPGSKSWKPLNYLWPTLVNSHTLPLLFLGVQHQAEFLVVELPIRVCVESWESDVHLLIIKMPQYLQSAESFETQNMFFVWWNLSSFYGWTT